MKWARAKQHRKVAGLGDLVAVVAQPIARAIDRVAGTDIEHCAGCARRRAALNRVGRIAGAGV